MSLEVGSDPEGFPIFFQLGAVLALVGLNGFFVASEFAIVKVRPSQVDQAAKLKPRRALATRLIIENLDPYLSACQLGITIASLALGFLIFFGVCANNIKLH
jgi:CBS domain containing-hemolysin-like protein